MVLVCGLGSVYNMSILYNTYVLMILQIQIRIYIEYI